MQAPANLIRSPTLQFIPRQSILRKLKIFFDTQRLQRRLPECQILFANYAFVIQILLKMEWRRGF